MISLQPAKFMAKPHKFRRFFFTLSLQGEPYRIFILMDFLSAAAVASAAAALAAADAAAAADDIPFVHGTSGTGHLAGRGGGKTALAK